jgi:hypothetical protein
MEKQDPGEFSGRVVIGPVNSRSTIARVKNKRLERRVERS